MPVFPADPIDPYLPGALIEDDYQYEFRGVLLGHGTPFVVEKISGLLGNPQTRGSDIDRANSHGSYPGALLYSPRTIQFDLKLSTRINDDAMEDLLDALSSAFQPPTIRQSRTLDVFAYKRPGRDARQFFCRATKFDADSDFLVAKGLASASIELVAPDPISYDLEFVAETITLGSGETTGSTTVTNEGNFRNGTAPLLAITGPATNPIVENETDDGRAVRLQVALAANQIARVNMQTCEVAIQTGGDGNPWVEDYSIVRTDNEFWNLLPGSNSIVYTRTGSATTSLMTVLYTNAWSRG